MEQSEVLEVSRCPHIDAQYREYHEYLKKEKDKRKKREYLHKKKAKLRDLEVDCQFDHQVVDQQMRILSRYSWQQEPDIKSLAADWNYYYQWNQKE